MRALIRVDDVGQMVHEQHKPDKGLAYFREWWAAGGWGDAPIYLGVVPAMLDQAGIDYLLELEATTGAVICLHGWDHKKATLGAEDIARAAEVFPDASCVIPPYNAADQETIEATAKLPGRPVLFGGFDGQDHAFGLAPCILPSGVLHLNADRTLYARCWEIVERLEGFKDPGYPVVCTLHNRWDVDRLDGVGALRRALEGRIVSVDEARP